MERYKFDEQNELWYELCGDYYLPCLTAPENNEAIGIWGERHRGYLKENKNAVYTALLLSGKLNSYLADIDRQAENMFSQIVKDLAKSEDVTEALKACDQMAWVGAMNNIRERARELVNSELIFS